MVSLIIIRFCYTALSNTDALIKSSKTRSLDTECPQDKQWSCFNSITKAYGCNQAAISGQITCSNDGPRIWIGSCATYNDNTQVLSFSKINVQIEHKLMATIGQKITYSFLLPTVLTELNDYMYGPLNMQLELCRAHTLRAHCAIYIVAFVCMAIIL